MVNGAVAPALHADETKFIELHLQTQHKLEVLRREYGGYLGAIAQAGKRGTVDASRIFINEVCCGAGSHLSLDNPRNEVPGTAMLACMAARQVQRAFPDTRVSVRLVDSDSKACERLGKRVAEFCAPGVTHPEFVDVRVIDKTFESQLLSLLAETKKPNGRYCSLWSIDPFGTSVIPRESLRPLVRAGRGVEIIINLDVRGIQRKRNATHSPKATPGRERLRDGLTALYGDDRWDVPPGPDATDEADLRNLARMYADSFSDGFAYKNIYKLEASDAQDRYLIHLTHSPRGRDVFEAAYKATLRTVGGSKALSITDRDKRVQWLFARYAGTTVSFESMVGLPECRLDRGQLATVLRRAVDTKHGVYDKIEKRMHWNTECLNPPVLPLDPKQHKEKRRARKINERLMQPGLFDGVVLPN
jgi:three-Cys-motif partner protein